MPLVAVKCNSLINCICPDCYTRRMENSTAKYTKQQKDKCRLLVIEFLSDRKENYFSLSEITHFTQWEYNIIRLTILALYNEGLLKTDSLSKGKDGRRVKCYAIK